MPYHNMLKQTFNKEFMNMISVCLFVPFLHNETPKPQNVPKMPAAKEALIPHAGLIKEVLNQRTRIGQCQKEQENEKKMYKEIHYDQEDQEVQEIQEAKEAREVKPQVKKPKKVKPRQRSIEDTQNSMSVEVFEIQPRKKRSRPKSKSPDKDFLAISHNLDVPFKRIQGRAHRRLLLEKVHKPGILPLKPVTTSKPKSLRLRNTMRGMNRSFFNTISFGSPSLDTKGQGQGQPQTNAQPSINMFNRQYDESINVSSSNYKRDSMLSNTVGHPDGDNQPNVFPQIQTKTRQNMTAEGVAVNTSKGRKKASVLKPFTSTAGTSLMTKFPSPSMRRNHQSVDTRPVVENNSIVRNLD